MTNMCKLCDQAKAAAPSHAAIRNAARFPRASTATAAVAAGIDVFTSPAAGAADAGCTAPGQRPAGQALCHPQRLCRALSAPPVDAIPRLKDVLERRAKSH